MDQGIREGEKEPDVLIVNLTASAFPRAEELSPGNYGT